MPTCQARQPSTIFWFLKGGQGALFSRGAAVAPVVAVLCCAPRCSRYLAILPVFATSSSSTFSPHPELTSCANLPSKAAFNYFFVPGSCGGCALLCSKMLHGASQSYLAILPVFAKPSSSTFLPHPELTSCANLPSKATFN